MLIGIGEGVITALVLAAIAQARPDLLGLPAPAPVEHASSRMGREKTATLVAFGLLISLGLALFVSPFASKWPDGLDKTAEVLGFKDKEIATPTLPAPIPDYEMPGISSRGIATGIAGVTGTVVVFALAWLLARALVPRRSAEASADPAPPR
jgi:hypothetical protein